jgi:hypothetical protein
MANDSERMRDPMSQPNDEDYARVAELQQPAPKLQVECDPSVPPNEIHFRQGATMNKKNWVSNLSDQLKQLYDQHWNNCRKLVAALHGKRPQACNCTKPELDGGRIRP